MKSNAIKRHSCRAIILTPKNEILLIRIENPEGSWNGWITPGGGVDGEESEQHALRRELQEELGIDLEIGAKVWRRCHTFPWKGQVIEQYETFYFVHVANRFDQLPNPDAPDIIDLKEFRWWTMEELERSDDHFAPSRLGFHLSNLIDHGLPGNPIDVGV